MKLTVLAATVAGSASCVLVTDFDGYDYGTTTTASQGGGGGAACAPPLTSCGDACVDLNTDPAHCGACAHDCFGADCENGQCAPEELANGLGPIKQMVIDDTHVYFVVDGAAPCPPPTCTVSRFPKGGGTLQLLASDVREPTGLTVDETYVYVSAYTSGSGDGIRRVPKAGGTTETVDPCNTAVSVGVDNDFVFFVTASCGGTFELRRARKRDPSQLVIVEEPTPDAYGYATYGYMAVGPNDVFWVSRQALMTAPKTLASVTALVDAPAHGRGIARDDDGLWVVFGGDIYAVSEDGMSVVPFATMQITEPPRASVFIGIATDRTHVYWPSDHPDPQNGTIVKRAKTPDDAEPVVIASGQPGPFAVAVDATHAYWANTDGSIWRVAL